MPKQTPKSVLETILEWSVQRPAWQRDGLRRIVAEGKPDADAVKDAVSLCKKGRGAEGIELEARPLLASHLPANPGAGASIRLVSVANVIGVNQLSPVQTLPLAADGLTVIYGQNGTGKSGYARVLKRACRARHAGAIMPDAFNPPQAQKATATITVIKGTAAPEPIDWIDADQPDAVLSAVSVFDRDCGSVHVREKNEVAFRPFGLDVPDELAGLCQAVKTVLQFEQTGLEQKRDAVFSKPTWSSNTKVGKIMAALSPQTDLATLRSLGEMSPEDRERHGRLRDDLSKDPVEAAAQTRLFADGVRQLRTLIDGTAAWSTDAELIGAKALADDASSKRKAANLAAKAAFEGLAVQGVGTGPWRELWEAARRFAQATTTPDAPFPPERDAPCLLCQQPLGEDATSRMQGFEQFIKQDTEADATAAEAKLSVKLRSLNGHRVNGRVLGQTRKRIALDNFVLAKSTIRFLASARLRRAKCLDAINAQTEMHLPAAEASPSGWLATYEERLRAYATELDAAANAEGRRTLETEFHELTDRIAVETLLPIADAECQRLRDLKLVADCIAETSTNTITKLGNDIADNVITPKMRDQFQSEIVRLAADKVRVEVVRSGGQFGSPQYQVRFFSNPKAKVHDVLSEGEQTCVALAAFLTELATAPHDSALVFDDPVSSLDHRWRNRVAQRLVEEVDRRQIVVFTHDLIFVNDLCDMAQRAGKKLQMLTLSRGPAGAGVVSDGLPWRASGIRDRIDKLEKTARSTRALYDAGDEDAYRNAALPIYGDLRATWERALEDIVFGGVIHRHRDYINTKGLRKVTVLEEADCVVFEAGFKRCCDLIEAHDPSRGRDAEVPTPDEILADIKTLDDWAASLRDRQKDI